MQLILAAISKRALAVAIDYGLFSFAYALILMQFGTQSTHESGRLIIELDGWRNILPVAIWILTFPVMESFEGKTIGKKLLKLKVVKLNGSPYSAVDSFKRRICDWIDFTFLGLPALIISSNTRLRQRLGDMWAGTVVVNDAGEVAEDKEATGF